MKTVLMVTRPFHPSNASAVHRAVAFAKYLPCFGWKPVVVCKRYTAGNSPDTFDAQLAHAEDCCEVVRVDPYANLLMDRIESRIWAVLGGGRDDYRNPLLLTRRMLSAAEKVIRQQRVDAIWSTFRPGMDHRIAAYLSREYSLPWVADFRDLPDQSSNTRNTRYTVRQEIKICAGARALTVTSKELGQRLRTRHKIPVYTILNGFDPEDYETKHEAHNPGRGFNLNHFGWLYEYRDPSVLFEGIDRAADRGTIDIRDVNVNFYGASGRMVHRFVRKYACASRTRAKDRLPYKTMIAHQKASQVLLLVASPMQGGAIPAKLYSYLACRRPILNVPGDGGGTDRILKQTKAGVTLRTSGEIASWLERTYKAWKCTGALQFSGDDLEIQKFSRKRQAGQLAEILHGIASDRRALSACAQ